MRWKRSFPVALAVLLLITFSWAGVCDAACLTKNIQPECHISHASSMSQTAHSHCMHMKKTAGLKNTRAKFVDTPSGCSHTSCSQPVSSLTPVKNILLSDVLWAITGQASIVEPDLLPHHFTGGASPPSIAVRPTHLSMTLRI